MNKIQIIQIILASLSGLLLIGYGNMDDSPGAGGVGLLTILTSLFVAYKLFKQ